MIIIVLEVPTSLSNLIVTSIKFNFLSSATMIGCHELLSKSFMRKWFKMRKRS
jgi:hypothetical protein